MARKVIGREEEVSSVRAFVDGAQEGEGPVALVLEGEPGIGKSTLWLEGVEHAAGQGVRVLLSRPSEAERDLAYVVLGDLFEDVLADVLPVLTPPRRRALEAALLVDRAPEQPVDPRALGVAIRASLKALAERAPLVLAVDDEQWLDASSANVLRFALRRLRSERILVLLARRLDEESDARALENALEPEAVKRLRLGPLSLGALHLVLQQRLGRTFARPTLLRLLELSGGNPFYALEFAGGLGPEASSRYTTEPFPLPESLERLVSTRIARLAGTTREALLLVAAHGRPSAALLRAAGIASEALDPALAAQVVERTDGVIRFAHPLLASALYQGASREERRRAHGRLAMIVTDQVDRGRHLALAAEEPDGEIAAALEEAAGLARARGAILAAAELGEHALRLTPPEALRDGHRRALSAATAQLEAGEARRARALVLDFLEWAPTGAPRAEALVLLSDIEEAGAPERAIALRREALEAAVGLPRLQAEVHLRLGDILRFTEDVATGNRHAEAALALAETLEDVDLRAEAVARLASGRFRAGVAGALQLAEEAAELAAAAPDARLRMRVVLQVALPLVWSFHLEKARSLLETSQREWGERDERASAAIVWYLGLAEFKAGQFALAAGYAERAREIDRQYAFDEREAPTSLGLVALIAAHRGELDRGRALAERALALAESQPALRALPEALLGLIALWRGDRDDALARFADADESRRATGVSEPAMFWWHADRVEALLALNRIDQAAELVDAWEADAVRLGRTVMLAHAGRCRGLLAASRGDVEEALATLERAIPLHEEVGDAFGGARTLLALGVLRRRARQKRGAREAIEAALAAFETAGAAGWAETARAELGRIGGRTREQGLTAAERRVAALVAAGQTNREVAAALFLGERTVETHLSHVYAKLGVRSRAELARTYRPDEQSSGELTISS
jgi:DNA-binding CsgD family transcriptional regulator